MNAVSIEPAHARSGAQGWERRFEAEGLHCLVLRRMRGSMVNSANARLVATNVPVRDYSAQAPTIVRVEDITDLLVASGWACFKHMRTELFRTTLRRAVAARLSSFWSGAPFRPQRK